MCFHKFFEFIDLDEHVFFVIILVGSFNYFFKLIYQAVTLSLTKQFSMRLFNDFFHQSCKLGTSI